MRPNPKISVYLVAISVGLLLVLCQAVWSDDAAGTKPGIPELQQKRLALLEKMADVANKLFQNARIDHQEVHAAQRELWAARLEYAQTREERIKACDDAIKEALEYQSVAEARKANARGSEFGVLTAQAYVLELQIARAKAEAGK